MYENQRVPEQGESERYLTYRYIPAFLYLQLVQRRWEQESEKMEGLQESRKR